VLDAGRVKEGSGGGEEGGRRGLSNDELAGEEISDAFVVGVAEILLEGVLVFDDSDVGVDSGGDGSGLRGGGRS